MATTKLEKIANLEDEIKELTKKKAKLKQQHNAQERKARNHRLIQRGATLESLMADTIKLTDDQFKTFLQKTITTEYAKRILNELKALPPEKPAETQGDASEPDSETDTEKPAGAAQSGSTDASRNEGNGARVTG